MYGLWNKLYHTNNRYSLDKICVVQKHFIRIKIIIGDIKPVVKLDALSLKYKNQGT